MKRAGRCSLECASILPPGGIDVDAQIQQPLDGVAIPVVATSLQGISVITPLGVHIGTIFHQKPSDGLEVVVCAGRL